MILCFYNIIFLSSFSRFKYNLQVTERIRNTFEEIFLITVRRIDTLLYLEVWIHRICLFDRDLIESNKCHVYFRYLSLTSKVTEYFASHCHEILRFFAYACLPDFSTEGKKQGSRRERIDFGQSMTPFPKFDTNMRTIVRRLSLL